MENCRACDHREVEGKEVFLKSKQQQFATRTSAQSQVQVRTTQVQIAASKLRRLRQLAEGLPGSGWVQPQDLRVLLRFLLARQLNVERALEMLQHVLHWRQQHGVSNALPLWDKALHERFDRYFKCLAFTGKDLDGDPVIVERCGKECVLASLERSRQESCKDGTIRGFQDMSFADRRLLALSKAMGRIESDNYPEANLSERKVIVVRAPWFFPAVFQMFKPFMDPGTVAKISVPKSHETRDVLLRHLPATAIPKELGGCLKDEVQLLPPGGVRLAVGHGSVVGHPTLDKVCLQPEKVCASTAFVAAAEMSDVPFSLYPFDGVVGLGMPGLSRNKEYNFLGNLAEAEALEKDRFTVWLAKQVDQEDSEIAFGEIPRTRLGSEIAWFPLSSTEGLWQVEMKDLTVNLVRQGLCKAPCHVAFDTGTGVLAGPRHMVETLKQDLNVASDCSNWDDLPALGVELADGVFNIEKYEYVQKTKEGCFLQLVALDTVKPVLFLGTPFLERYVTIYDRAFLRLGLAFAVHRSEATGESGEEARQRLMGREALGDVAKHQISFSHPEVSLKKSSAFGTAVARASSSVPSGPSALARSHRRHAVCG
eukprot:s104_g11.t1